MTSLNVLFAWELGLGLGHLGKILPLAEEFLRRGAKVTAAVRDVDGAAGMFQSLAVQLLPAPVQPLSPPNRIADIRTFAHVLHNTAFADAEDLSRRCDAWVTLFELVQPQLIICEHAPTALLAARAYQARRVPFGTGFTLPGAVYPFPDWRTTPSIDPVMLARDESQVLTRCNHWLETKGLARLPRLCDLYQDVDDQILGTIAELDPFPPAARTGCSYDGVWTSGNQAKPEWPPGPGRKIFMYLKEFPLLPGLLQLVSRLKARALLVSPGLAPELAARLSGPLVRVTTELVDLWSATRECDLALNHGSHNAAAVTILAGKPQLCLPQYLEQRLTGERIAAQGAGVVVLRDDGHDVVAKFRQLWEGASLGHNAAAIAERLISRTSNSPAKTVARLETLCGRSPAESMKS